MSVQGAQDTIDTVLVVEDDPDARYVYGLMLSSYGYDVAAAGTGPEGLRMAHELHPGAILMDVTMPGMDGWTVTERLKGSEDTADIPIIIISADATRTTLTRLQAAGADAYLTKPLNMDEFLGTIEHNLDLRRGTRPCSAAW
jgi:CheY-like chemotaxis protein